MRALLLIPLLIAGCASGEQESPDVEASPPEAAVLGNDWIATHIDGERVPDGARMSLVFTRRSAGNERYVYGGTDGCNGFGGSYAFSPEALGVRRVSASRPALSVEAECPGGVSDASVAYMDGISAMREIRHEGERLWIVDSSNTERVAFRALEPLPVDLGALRHGEWTVAVSTDPRVPGEAAGTVSFSESTFEGRSGCHWVQGTYEIERDNVIVMETSQGTDPCPQESMSRFPPIRTGKLSVTPDSLRLMDETGALTLFLRPGGAAGM